MAKKCIAEAEDNSIRAVIYQGKPLSQWENEFKGEFTAEQLFKLIRSGVDLGRIQLGLVDEAKVNEANDFNDPAFNGEEFFFEDSTNVDEAAMNPEDIMTVGDLIAFLRRNADLNDKVMFRTYDGKQEHMLFNLSSKGGVAVIDLVKAKKPLEEDIELDGAIAEDFMTVADLKQVGSNAYKHNADAWLLDNIVGVVNGNVIDFSEIKYVRPEGYPSNGTFFLLDGTEVSRAAYKKEKSLMLYESLTPRQWDEAIAWFNKNGYEIEDDEQRLEQFGPQGDQVLFKAGKSPTGKDKVFNGQEAYNLYLALKESTSMKKTNEGRSWQRGGYGGTGRSYRSFNGNAPRGAAIGWYAVSDLDPKAKGKMPGWRCGPSNFPFDDLLYPNRKYKVGTMVMRNKYVNAGSESGTLYIAVPSYFAAIKDNDTAALKLLADLGIPLDLTFGMDPNDDYSVTYTLKK